VGIKSSNLTPLQTSLLVYGLMRCEGKPAISLWRKADAMGFALLSRCIGSMIVLGNCVRGRRWSGAEDDVVRFAKRRVVTLHVRARTILPIPTQTRVKAGAVLSANGIIGIQFSPLPPSFSRTRWHNLLGPCLITAIPETNAETMRDAIWSTSPALKGEASSHTHDLSNWTVLRSSNPRTILFVARSAIGPRGARALY
jgi:hypothetical protein